MNWRSLLFPCLFLTVGLVGTDAAQHSSPMSASTPHRRQTHSSTILQQTVPHAAQQHVVEHSAADIRPLLFARDASSSPAAVPLPQRAALLSVDRRTFDELYAADAHTTTVAGFPMPGGAVVTLELQRVRVLSGDSRLIAATADGEQPFEPERHLLWRGSIRELPGSYVYLAVFPTFCSGYIELPTPAEHGRTRYAIAPVAQDAPLMVVYDEHSAPMPARTDALCGTEEPHDMEPEQPHPQGNKKGRVYNQTTLVADIAIDCDYEFFQDHNASLSRASSYAIVVTGAVSAIYERDMNLRLNIPYLRVWTSADPYTGTTSGALLSGFRSAWNSGMTGVERSLAHLFSGVNSIGGIAYLNTVCSATLGYGVSGMNNNITYPTTTYAWDTDVLAHELGHNFSSPHTHSCTWAPAIDSCYQSEGSCFTGTVPRSGTIMGYCHLTQYGTQLLFHPRVATKIRLKAEQASCVRDASASAVADVGVRSMVSPAVGGRYAAGTPVAPSVVVYNAGTAAQTALPVTCTIRTSAGTLVYSSTQTVSTLAAGASVTLTFAPAALSAVDTYSCTAVIALANDSYQANNTMVRPFSIGAVSGTLSLTAPNSALQFTAGETTTISWTKNGVASVLVEFSADNGSTWQTLHSGHTGTSMQWVVPATATSQGRIRVASVDNTALCAMSAVGFSIAVTRDVQVTAFQCPVAGATTAAPCSPRLLVRNNSSSPLSAVPVRLRIVSAATNREVYRNTVTIPALAAGVQDTLVFPQFSTTASGTYALSARVLLSNDQNTANDSLARAFQIAGTTATQPVLTLVCPNGGEQWQAGVSQTIDWNTSGFVAFVAIEYSNNGGASWWTIADSVQNTGEYVWTPTVAPTPQARLRVRCTTAPAIRDESDSPFQITPIPVPTGVNAVVASSRVELSWQHASAVGRTGYAVYRRTSGSTPVLIATTGAGATGLTDTSVQQCVVYTYTVVTRVGLLSSDHSAPVTAVPMAQSTVVLTSPAGGERVQVGTAQTVAWTASGCIDSVVVRTSADNGTSWTAIAVVANTGAYVWTPQTVQSQVLVEVCAVGNPDVAGRTASALAVVPVAPPASLTASGGTDRVELAWSASTSASVSAYRVYRRTGQAQAELLAITGTTAYTDTAVTPGLTYFYAIAAVANGYFSAMSSEAEATPAAPPTGVLVLTAPNGGEVWYTASTATVSWQGGGTGMVSIAYSQNGGCSWTTVTSATANTGAYSWTVGELASTRAVVRVASVSTPSMADTSEAVFTVRSSARTAVSLRLFLEGAYQSGAMGTWLQNAGVLPQQQPYTAAPFSYSGSESLDPCLPSSWIVDWVLLEFRQSTSGAAIARRAALLRRDGYIVDTDGYSPVLCSAAQIPAGNYYVVVRHRNHLAVMTASAVELTTGQSEVYDMSTAMTRAYSTAQQALKQMRSDIFAVPGGDVDHDGIINAEDRVRLRNALGQSGYLPEDVRMDGTVTSNDRSFGVYNSGRFIQVP